MTKAKMIETLRDREAELWLMHCEYRRYNAPLDSVEALRAWEDNDSRYMKQLYAWATASEMLESIGVQPNWEHPAHEEASQLNTEVWKLTHRKEIA